MEINTLLLNFHRWTAIFCRRQSNSDVSYLEKNHFQVQVRFSLFRLLSLVALCCSWFMSKGRSENLIKYFIFLSSQVNKYWSGRLQSQNLARRHKRTVTCNGTVLVLLLHFSLQFSAEKYKNYNSWVWVWLVILLPLLIVMVIYCYYYYYYYYYYLSSGQFYNYCLIQLQTTRTV